MRSESIVYLYVIKKLLLTYVVLRPNQSETPNM